MRVLTIAAVLVAGFWALSPVSARMQQHETINSLTSKLSRTKKENNLLRVNIRKLENSPTYWEWLARTDLGLVKPDEEAYVVIQSRDDLKKTGKNHKN